MLNDDLPFGSDDELEVQRKAVLYEFGGTPPERVLRRWRRTLLLAGIEDLEWRQTDSDTLQLLVDLSELDRAQDATRGMM